LALAGPCRPRGRIGNSGRLLREGLGRRNSSLVWGAHQSLGKSRSGEGRGLVPHCPGDRPRAGHTGLRIARRDEPRPAMGRAAPARRGTRAAGTRLRLVHRGLRYPRPERSEGAPRGTRSMSAVRNWLEEIGLAQYAEAFEANDIDTDLLTQIDDQVLKDIGVSSARHRLRLGNAIATLAPTPL